MRLGELCNIHMGYSFRTAPENKLGTEIYLIQPINMTKYYTIDLSNCIETDKCYYSKHRLQKEEILLTTRSTFKSVIFNSDIKCVATNPICRITIKDKYKKDYSNHYLNAWFNSKYGQHTLNRYVDESTVKQLAIKSLGQIKVTFPDRTMQDNIAKLWELNNERIMYQDKIDLLKQQQIDYVITRCSYGKTNIE